MIHKCTLSPEINKCEYFDSENGICKREIKCSMWEDGEETKQSAYIRKERWYEKYYKK